ncbi:MAG: DNA/RNA nuclease SfsA [Myxococcota bacterium]
MPLRADLAGRLVRRYKRFLADVETADGRILTVHCPNPGSMLGCAREGASVRCSTSDDPRRKLRHTLEMIRLGRAWVGLHTLRANQLVRLALEAGAIRELRGYRRIRPEVSVAGSRLDFHLEEHARDPRPAWLEVKSVTLARGDRAEFPDSVTERGRRHTETLLRLRRRGQRAVLLFVVQRADCRSVAPADDLDPAYGAALRRAAQAGVEVRAVRARVSPRGIQLDGALPVQLS